MPGQRGKKAADSVGAMLSLPHSFVPPKAEMAISRDDEDEYCIISLLF